MQEKFELLLGYYYCNSEIHNCSPNDDDNERTNEGTIERNGVYVRFSGNLMAMAIHSTIKFYFTMVTKWIHLQFD